MKTFKISANVILDVEAKNEDEKGDLGLRNLPDNMTNSRKIISATILDKAHEIMQNFPRYWFTTSL